MSRADPHRALLRALAARYPGLVVLSSRSEPWASVTFTGARHMLACEAGTDVSGIEEAEFVLHGHIVVDVAVETEGERLTIEALTIEAA